MAFIVYHQRYKGKLCAVISHERAIRLQKLVATQAQSNVAADLKLYLANIKQISLGKGHTKSPVITDVTPNYDERYR